MKETTNLFDHLLQNRLATHLLFWTIVLLIYPLFTPNFPTLCHAYIAKALMLPVQIAATYGFLYYAFPKFVYTRRYARFFLFLVMNIILFSTLAHIMRDIGSYYLRWTWNHQVSPHSFIEIVTQPFQNIWRNGEDIYLTVFIVMALKVVKQRFEEKHQLTLLQKEKANAEIKLLKAQINPRILSKTLHQLYDLTKEKSDAAPEVVIKLSEMLDYMLYQCNAPKVSVHKEIELIQNYLELEQLRYGERLTLQFEHQLATPSIEITPLLLLSLVEAAFSEQANALSSAAVVSITIQEEKEQLRLFLNATLLPVQTTLSSNFKKQLELLYPNQYHLETVVDKGVYSLDLRLQLAEKNPKKLQ